MNTSIWFDSDYAHDKVTFKSISGIIIFVGKTPVKWTSTRQGAIKSSTYGAEFMAGRSAVEEAKAIRYMLRSLGCKLDGPTQIYGDNLGMLQSSTIPDSTLKKKWEQISFHIVREATAAGIVDPRKVLTTDNIADALTKSLPGSTLKILLSGVYVSDQVTRKRKRS